MLDSIHENIVLEADLSKQKDAQFMERLEFAAYGESALLLMHDIMNLTEDQFFEKHKTFKRTFLEKISQLEQAIREHDYLKRIELYDYFMEVL